jgi:hypothetical protein
VRFFLVSSSFLTSSLRFSESNNPAVHRPPTGRIIASPPSPTSAITSKQQQSWVSPSSSDGCRRGIPAFHSSSPKTASPSSTVFMYVTRPLTYMHCLQW